MADDNNPDGIYYTQHSFDFGHHPDGRRCSRWYLVDQHGDKHLAVIGTETSRRDGHYVYTAEEPFASIKGLNCYNKSGVHKWLESMITPGRGDADHAAQSRAAATPTASTGTSGQHAGKRKAPQSPSSKPSSAKQPRRMHELNELQASDAVLPGSSAAASDDGDDDDNDAGDDNDQGESEGKDNDDEEEEEGESQGGDQQAGESAQGGDRKVDAAKATSAAKGRQPPAAAAPEQERRTPRTRSAANAGARVLRKPQAPPTPKPQAPSTPRPGSAVPDLATLAQQLQKAIVRDSASRAKLEQDHKRLQQQHKRLQQEHQKLKQEHNSVVKQNSKLEENEAYLQQQLETEAAGALSGLQTGPGGQDLMQHLLEESKAQRDAERTRSAAELEAERTRSAAQLDAERARFEAQLQAEREKVTELHRTVAVLEYAAGVGKQQLEAAQQEVQELRKQLAGASDLMLDPYA